MPMQFQAKRPTSLMERLSSRAKVFREQAIMLPEGPERQAILQKASQCEHAAEIDGWLQSEELMPPR